MEPITDCKHVRELADLTFDLLRSCQEKERRVATLLDITVPEFRVLRSFRGDDRMTYGALSGLLGLSESRMTRIAGGLEEKGFIVREMAPFDRRGVVLCLTPKGSSLVSDLEDRYTTIHRSILQGIPREMHDPLLRGLGNLLNSLNLWLEGI